MNYNASFLTRVYPGGHRVDSSNYWYLFNSLFLESLFLLFFSFSLFPLISLFPLSFSPIKAWVGGCQMVALNFQTADEPMHRNKMLFQDNGLSGYLLKPLCLRREGMPSSSSLTRISVEIFRFIFVLLFTFFI